MHPGRTHASSYLLVAITVAMITFCQAGCIKKRPIRHTPRIPAVPVIALDVLAAKLDFQVTDSSPRIATLRRGANSVMIFPEPGSQVYVNGMQMPDVGRIKAINGTIYVPADLERRIAALLPSEMAKTPKVDRPKKPRRAKVNLGRVVIDAGHGGSDGGTNAASKNFGVDLEEKTVNLAIAKILARQLKARGVEIHMTRTSDVHVSLDKRIAIANRLKPKLFVSIHADSNPSPSFHGYMVLVNRRASSKSHLAAKIIVRHMLSTGLRSIGVRVDQRDVRVLKKTTCPAVLVETGCLSNLGNMRILASDAKRRIIAKAIAGAIVEYLKRTSPPKAR